MTKRRWRKDVCKQPRFAEATINSEIWDLSTQTPVDLSALWRSESKSCLGQARKFARCLWLARRVDVLPSYLRLPLFGSIGLNSSGLQKWKRTLSQLHNHVEYKITLRLELWCWRPLVCVHTSCSSYCTTQTSLLHFRYVLEEVISIVKKTDRTASSVMKQIGLLHFTIISKNIT